MRSNFLSRRHTFRVTLVDTLKIVCRHGFLLVPIIVVSFGLIAGGIGTELGVHHLFRDLPGEFKRPPDPIAAIRSASFRTQAFATILMGLLWTVFLLIHELERDPPSPRPLTRVSDVLWPGVVILSVLQLAAGQISLSPLAAPPTVVTFAYGMLGSLVGLAVVATAVWLTIRFTRRSRYSQLLIVCVVTAIGLSLTASLPTLMPGVAVFIVLGWFVIAYAAITRTPRTYRFPALLAVAVFIGFGAATPDKLEFPGLGQLDAKVTPPGSPGLQPTAVLDAWLKLHRGAHGANSKPKLVVVAASGGAYRASYWTAVVLDHLAMVEKEGRLPAFTDSIRVLTGASGGMVGAGYFATREDRKSEIVKLLDDDIAIAMGHDSWLSYFKNANRDSFTPLVQGLVQCDFWSLLWPFDLHVFPCTRDGSAISRGKGRDRGIVLDRQWPSLDRESATFANLRAGEAEGRRPSIILSPVLVPSGRPLLISNLDLEELRGTSPDVVELFHKMPEARSRFKLSTGVRMSATFPYISPAILLPQVIAEPRERVVDAGYRDNDGISVATAFLTGASVKAWLNANTSGVVVVQINAFASDYRPRCAGDASVRPVSPLPTSWLQAAFAWFTTPFEGVLAARVAASSFANRQQIRLLKEIYQDRFTHVEFSNARKAGFNWFMTEADLDGMRQEVKGDYNTNCLDHLVRHWKTAP